MDLDFLKREYGGDRCLVGNIDLNLLSLGTPADVREQVAQRIAQLGSGYRYMVSSSNAVTAYCKPENVRAMADAVAEYGTYSSIP
jgi:uroporphyrinogen-III decarboxylase